VVLRPEHFISLQDRANSLDEASGDAYVSARYTNNMNRSRQVIVLPQVRSA
jgi:hypothetical protein